MPKTKTIKNNKEQTKTNKNKKIKKEIDFRNEKNLS